MRSILRKEPNMNDTREQDLCALRSVKEIDELFFRKKKLLSLYDTPHEYLLEEKEVDSAIDTLISLLESRRANNLKEAQYIFDAIKKSNDESVSELLERLSNKNV